MIPFQTIQHTVIHRERFYFPRLQHEDWTAYIVISGSFRCTVSEKTEELLPGDVYIIPPRAEFDRTVTEPLLVHFIRFTLKDTSLPFAIPTGKLHYADTVRTESTVAMLKQAQKLPEEQQELCLRHCLTDLLLQYTLENRAPSEHPEVPEDETVRDVLEYLNKHFQEPLRLTELAARHHISPSGLIKKFRKAVGMPPQRYLIERRIRQARRLLVNTALPMGEVAVKTGFENGYYFSKAFKKEVGIPPTEYRKKYLL